MNIDEIIIEERMITINDIANRLHKETINYKPHCLTSSAKGQIIESIVLRLPVPTIICTIDKKGEILSVYNGSKIIEAVDSLFKNDSFTIAGASILTDLNGLTFSKVPPHIIRRIKETKINLICIRETTTEATKNIIKRYENMEG